MAGNVREWCLNKSDREGHYFILGGGWNDPDYSFTNHFTQHAFDRSLTNGIRCMKFLEEDNGVGTLSRQMEFPFRDFLTERPVSDQTFDIYLKMYSYDKTDLNAIRENVDDSNEDYVIEKILVDAAYGNERLILYVVLPKNGFSPFQTVVLFPGAGAISGIFANRAQPSDSYLRRQLYRWNFLLKTGRALVFPVLKGICERGDALNSFYPKETVFYKEHVVMWAKDIGRTIDYLETRVDIDTDRLAYFGFSWGGNMGAIMPVVETRFKTSVLYVAGLWFQRSLPEVDAVHFLPRLEMPVLMLNGKYDHFFPLETSQKPMFELLGTPLQHKKHVIYETGHIVPRDQLIKEMLNWLDVYLGPVRSHSANSN
jgi:pimeloyl-ACP methyl ester carboxylesterase